MFKGKRVVVFALPLYLQSTCSYFHRYESEYDNIKKLGIDEVYCLSVNDTFVMNSWFNAQEVSQVKAVTMVLESLQDV